MHRTILGVLTLSAGAVLAQPCEPAWGDAPAPAGHDGVVHAMLAFDDGSGQALYAGGDFSHVDGVPAAGIARWDGHAWEQVGAGLDSIVLALAAFDHGQGARLYAGGMYYLVDDSTLAEWDGVEWRAVPDTPQAWIGALGVSEIGGKPELYFSGPVFDYVRRWDGSSWRSVGDGLFGVFADFVEFDAGDGSAIYVGGGMAAIYKFDDAEWTAIDGDFSINGPIEAIERFDDGSGEALFIGGEFTRVPGFRPALRIARWDGEEWSQVGEGFDGMVRALAVFDDGSGDALYAAGEFTHTGEAELGHIARWDGSAWRPVGGGVDGAVTALGAFQAMGPALVAAGEFQLAGGAPSPGFAAWLGCACAADFDGDGVVDTRDVLAFLNAWAADEPSGDFNDDGVIDTRDVLAFLNVWSGGC